MKASWAWGAHTFAGSVDLDAVLGAWSRAHFEATGNSLPADLHVALAYRGGKSDDPSRIEADYQAIETANAVNCHLVAASTSVQGYTVVIATVSAGEDVAEVRDQLWASYDPGRPWPTVGPAQHDDGKKLMTLLEVMLRIASGLR